MSDFKSLDFREEIARHSCERVQKQGSKMFDKLRAVEQSLQRNLGCFFEDGRGFADNADLTSSPENKDLTTGDLQSRRHEFMVLKVLAQPGWLLGLYLSQKSASSSESLIQSLYLRSCTTQLQLDLKLQLTLALQHHANRL